MVIKNFAVSRTNCNNESIQGIGSTTLGVLHSGVGTPIKPWTMEQNFADWVSSTVQCLATRSVIELSELTYRERR